MTMLVALCFMRADSLAIQRLLLCTQPSFRLNVCRMGADNVADLQLPPALEKTVRAFQFVPDQKLRYQQLLFLAQKLAPMDEELQVDENKVPGCLSVVHVHASRDGDVINFVGNSDSQLTKGLAALLINGLSGSTNEQIQRVQPEFIQVAGLAQSLTPGRNNGFINMLAKMKQQAAALSSEEERGSVAMSARADKVVMSAVSSLGPIGSRMEERLAAAFDPAILELEDQSSQHAGHAGAVGFAGESHFALTIVSDAFSGVRTLKRHQMIYDTLEEEMKLIHALSINTLAPEETTG